MEIVMTNKIAAALAAAILLGTTALASAQPSNQLQHPRAVVVPNDALMLQDPRAYDPYAGTYFDNVAPYTARDLPDPYWGTPFQGVAPY
jgi:hypothetical protein